MRIALVSLLAAAASFQDLGKFQVFPPDNPWNWDVSRHAVHPNSDAYIASIGADANFHPDFGRQYGIPYCVVTPKQKKVKVTFEYADESDPGPYPIPDDAPIEGGADSDGDRHVLVIDKDSKTLYELFSARKSGDGWKAGSGAIFNLASNDLRREGWTSADAAGLPIFPGLVRYEEVARGEIAHAIRFTAKKTGRKCWYPARHFASRDDNPDLPPMGLRLRLKASYDLAKFPRSVQVILAAIKKHGIILADNGSDWYLTGATDPRWNDDELRSIKQLKGRDFEVVQTVTDDGKPIPPKPGRK
ncbi:MAG TPA: hypothetical protein VI643_07220 [Planctomycetota bacterium]|nr:hypothetical protein [Planctomycetota bacterium]